MSTTVDEHERLALQSPVTKHGQRPRLTRHPWAGTKAFWVMLISATTAFRCDSRVQNSAEAAAISQQQPTSTPSDLVEVPPGGKQFSPPLKKSQLPSGVWYCDMGDVHWAQKLEGNHQCPLCKMELRRKD
jgi:hypothetical protein